MIFFWKCEVRVFQVAYVFSFFFVISDARYDRSEIPQYDLVVRPAELPDDADILRHFFQP